MVTWTVETVERDLLSGEISIIARPTTTSSVRFPESRQRIDMRLQTLTPFLLQKFGRVGDTC
jgi:hypothetical protein